MDIVYIETSIVSHATAWPSSDPATSVLQIQAKRWLDEQATNRARLSRYNDRVWIRAIATLTALAVFAGTVVTAAGPHAGNESAPRLDVDLPAAARLHGLVVVWLLLVSTTYIIVLRRRVVEDPGVQDSAHALTRPMRLFGLAVAAQGAIGYIQYFNSTPALLVWFHILGACVVWIAVVRLVLAEHDSRGAAVEVDRVLQPS